MRKWHFLATTLTLLMAFVAADSPPNSCELCRSLQSAIVNFTDSNWNVVIDLATQICQVAGSGDLCSYMVRNFAQGIQKHKFKFLLKTNYYCNKLLEGCGSDFRAFNFTQFKADINRDFPRVKPVAEGAFPSAAKDAFKVLVLNDIHIQNDYKHRSAKRCKDPAGCCSAVHGMPAEKEKQAGYWGTPKAYCDMPEYFYNATLKHLREATAADRPDFIVLLGDNVGHQYFRQDGSAVSNATAVVLQEMKRVFPDVPVIPVLGNHECHPVEYLDFDNYTNFVYTEIVDKFNIFVPRGKLEEFKEKGFFAIEFPDQNVKFISVNSQILDGFNVYLMGVTTYPWDFLRMLARELYRSEKAGQKVILLNHIEITDYFAIRELNVALLYILERFQDTVVTYLSGHTHYDQLRFMRGQDGKVFAANYISPSITTSTCYNPSFRIYRYGGGKLVDYDQYYFDIDEANARAEKGDFKFEFRHAYSFLKRYGLKSTSKEEIGKLHERLKSRRDPAIKDYVSGYFCQLDLKGWENVQDEVLCELTDDIDEMYRCLWKDTRRGFPNNLPPLIFHYFLVNDQRLPKEKERAEGQKVQNADFSI